MANEKRLIDVDVAEKSIRTSASLLRANIGCGYDEGAADALSSVADMLKTMPTVDAVEVVYCDECKSHGSCIPEDTFRWMRIEKPYCCVGKRKTNTNFDAKMDGDGNG